jgi:hypothetical protein
MSSPARRSANDNNDNNGSSVNFVGAVNGNRNEAGTPGLSVILYIVGALIVFIAAMVTMFTIPNLADGNVTGPLTSIAIACLIFGVMIYLAVSSAATATNKSTESMLGFTMFVTFCVNLPLALFSFAAATSAVADAKRSLSS